MSRTLMPKKNKVLIIEDDHDIRVCFRDILESYNFDIYSATNGKDAFTLLNSIDELPALIISDLSMPIMDGNEFVQEKNKVEKLKAIPVLIVSANVEKVSVSDVAVMSKPVDMNTFVNKVYEYVPQEYFG
jgi:CheY-like chemotaxis protein